ncbi:MAG: transposase, partial [Planctomycetales bacterium]|nr:transposase [Planctomycetales bacterium]
IYQLERLRSAGQLKFGGSLGYLKDDVAWAALIETLKGTEWVSHIEPPYGESSDPQHVVRYLTRYLTGGPMGSSRLISADEQSVTFWAREGSKAGGEREQVPYTLSNLEFVRRWCMHIQPKQLTKTRLYGGWSTRHSDEYLHRCRAALQQAGLWQEPAVAQDEPQPDVDEPLKCCHCDSTNLILIWIREKPSWKDLLAGGSASCPAWYTKHNELAFSRFDDCLMIGVGCGDYADDGPAPWIESAEEPEQEQSAAVQLWLPGLTPSFDWQEASF